MSCVRMYDEPTRVRPSTLGMPWYTGRTCVCRAYVSSLKTIIFEGLARI